MTSPAPILVWFRNDLRLADHPALRSAVDRGAPVVPVYLHTPAAEGTWRRGAASRWWLHHALTDLDDQLRAKGSKLILRSGDHPLPLLGRLMEETGATEIHWNRRYEPNHVAVDTELKRALPVISHPGSMLVEPNGLRSQAGAPFRVFTPYYKAGCRQGNPPEPLPAPRTVPGPEVWPESEVLSEWSLRPRIPWDAGWADTWDPTLSGAAGQLREFQRDAMNSYAEDRDLPGIRGTSRLSPHLHFGQLSPRTVWHAIQSMTESAGTTAYTRQLVWRDFAKQTLFHFPHTDHAPLQEKYASFPWRDDTSALERWQRGETGYPIVDAGMRELWATGWMHNRVRMIVASFLVKDLLLPWQAGAAWFWDTLVDADLANNSLGWQWAAGCGADAAPYFRIFNPMIQSKKFDARGHYLRRWVPELRDLPDAVIHEPWKAPSPPSAYPAPMVDHFEARDRALEALNRVKGE